jgi:hypothetical protein
VFRAPLHVETKSHIKIARHFRERYSGKEGGMVSDILNGKHLMKASYFNPKKMEMEPLLSHALRR